MSVQLYQNGDFSNWFTSLQAAGRATAAPGNLPAVYTSEMIDDLLPACSSKAGFRLAYTFEIADNLSPAYHSAATDYLRSSYCANANNLCKRTHPLYERFYTVFIPLPLWVVSATLVMHSCQGPATQPTALEAYAILYLLFFFQARAHVRFRRYNGYLFCLTTLSAFVITRLKMCAAQGQNLNMSLSNMGE